MTAKEYLRQAYRLDHRINSKIEQVEVLNSLATKATVTITGMPKKPNTAIDSMSAVIAKIVDLQTEINGDIDRLVDLKRDIIKKIKCVENLDYRTLLEKRYLNFETWEQIAVDMAYSIQHTYRIRDKAINEISNILKDDRK